MRSTPRKNADHTVEQWVNFYREILKNSDCEKPIWATGFGFATSEFEDQKAVTETEQIDFAIKELVMLLGENVERIAYSEIPGFALSDEGADEWNAIAAKLAGAKFENLTLDGKQYCPLTTSCFFDATEYRADTGESIFGLPNEPNAMKKNRTYSFLKDDGSRVFVFWTTGEVGVGVVESPFSDITPASAHLAAILGLTERGIISGYSNGTFGPDLQINRAEFLKILVGATKKPELEISGTKCFPDVEDEWFAPFVCYAKARKLGRRIRRREIPPGQSDQSRGGTQKFWRNAFGWSTTETDGAVVRKIFECRTRGKCFARSGSGKDFDKAENRGFVAELIWRALN